MSDKEFLNSYFINLKNLINNGITCSKGNGNGEGIKVHCEKTKLDIKHQTINFFLTACSA